MHRFHLPPHLCQSNEFDLSERDAHHARDVLRLKERERVVVLDGAGTECLCEVASVDARRFTLRVRQRQTVSPLPWKITLAQAVTRGKTMDLIVQKATELGAHRIVPVLSERTVSRLDGDQAGNKAGRWLETAVESIKQCGSAWLPQIETPVTPAALLARREAHDLVLVASLQPDTRHPREHFRAFEAEHRRRPESVCVWVGPEGDFTPAEVAAIRSSGALPITLGPLVLRSETAAIYCLAVINYELHSPA